MPVQESHEQRRDPAIGPHTRALNCGPPSAPGERRTVDRVDPDDNERQERLAAIEQTSGSADGVFPDGYLDDLRDDWPDGAEQPDVTGDADVFPNIQEVLDEQRAERIDSETLAILSNPDLVADINAGLADAEAGRVHTHDEVQADLSARTTTTPDPPFRRPR